MCWIYIRMKKNHYIPGVQGGGGRVEVAAGGRAGGVLLRHETEAYVTVIFVINIHNGNIL